MLRTPLVALALGLVGCAPAQYFYNFDITEQGAQNLTRWGERDVFEDPDVKLELLADPASFQAILVILHSRSEQPIEVAWHQVSVIWPDRVARPIRPDDSISMRIDPYTRVRARLIPFELPEIGAAAAGYDKQPFELVIPLTVKGKRRELRVHLTAHAVKI
jgi:hypothetical protein